jgi:hypothetical protein
MLTMKAEEIASSIWMSRCHLHGEDTRGYNMISPKYESPRCEPWCWNIYLQNWAIFGVYVGKYSSPMEHLGLVPAWPQTLGYLGNGLLRSSPVSPKTTGISHRHRLLSRHDALPCGILRWRRTSDVYSVWSSSSWLVLCE